MRRAETTNSTLAGDDVWTQLDEAHEAYETYLELASVQALLDLADEPTEPVRGIDFPTSLVLD